MKLYYTPGACSLSPHIVLLEAGLPVDLVLTDLKGHKFADGGDFYAINPKGYVPVLELASGERLTEGPAIVQYVADQVPAKQLIPAAGTMARYRAQEWLNFISTELHKGIGGLLNPAMPGDAKALMKTKALSRLKWVDSQLEGHDYLMGSAFSVPDAYLFVVTSWCTHVGLDIATLAHLQAFMGRMKSRPAVQAALKAEGLAN